MKPTTPVSDQTLASFVDGMLDIDGQARVIAAMEQDSAVRDKVYRLRRARDLMRLGFASAHPPQTDPAVAKSSRQRRFVQARLAGLVLLLVFTGGQLGYQIGYQHGSPSDASRSNPLVAGSTARLEKPEHVILHIGEASPAQFAAALGYAENFLATTRPGERQLAIITHAGGIDLLRHGVSPYEKQIKRLMRESGDVYFIACANAVGQLRKQGIEPAILTHVDASKPAMEQIIERVQSGWRYVRVATLAAQAGGG